MRERQWTAADFDYPLPDDLIAQVPPTERGTSRLLIVRPDDPPPQCTDGEFPDIITLIPPGDLLVVNTTRVRHARLRGTRPSGAPAEVLLIHPATDDQWIAIGTPGSAMRPGRQITLGDGVSIETVEVRDDGMRVVRFLGATSADAMARFGEIPLPPYIDRRPVANDAVAYQTVYAEREGSVAAPTAGLHFTEAILAELRARGVAIASLDLEVGPGTFRPMEAGDVGSHPMHRERFEIPAALVRAVAECRERGGQIWAVGTTVVRALESAASEQGSLTAGSFETALMIVPGFHFRVVDRLLTNFHLPRSTLLMLVSAFAGHEVTIAAYYYAVAGRYRFYSYGDAMALIPRVRR